MRNVFVQLLMEEARRDPDLYLLTADLGFRAFEPFQEEFPDRFVNVGVAEANMIGIAAGLALSGKKVCVYSIAPFVTLRCLEQIRNNICHHNLNINLIGVGGGFSYGNQGISHNTSEDLAVMRALPNMAVLCPGTRLEAEMATKAMFGHSGPVYIRLGRAPENDYYSTKQDYKLGDGLMVGDGQMVTLISVGNILEDSVLVAKELEASGISTRVISFLGIKPINPEMILKAAQETKAIFTIEEHSEIGGLGGAVSEILMESAYSDLIFKRFALTDECHIEIGSQKHLKKIHGLCADKIAEDIKQILDK
jgi:transketolase